MAESVDSTLQQLKSAIDECPIIDNHCHNLLKTEKLEKYDLLTATTEAHGDALPDTKKSLPHIRAIKQLRELYDCPANATWDDLLQKRSEIIANQPDELTRKCLERTHTLLLDDGLDNDADVHHYKWHDQFTAAPTRRIVRIETVAADIARVLCEEGQIPLSNLHNFEHRPAWVVFLQAFETAIIDEIRSDQVAGFKSVCCYRTGLDVNVADEIDVTAAGEDAFRAYLHDCAKGSFRISRKGLNDCLVISTCRLLTANYKQSKVSKPLQFHTGLGDNDISLLKSNPAHLQPLIARYPAVTFVLLHSAYPYTQEAGYLATVYKNAYLDLGEVFPMVNREGQVNIIKQAFEITPYSKLLWSTDGHHFPETYWLANKQFKGALYVCLAEFVRQEDMTVEQAIEAAQDIFFHNSNRIYQLGLHFSASDEPQEVSREITLPIRELAPPASTDESNPYNVHLFETFARNFPGQRLSYVVVQWLDYMGQLRCRIVPNRAFYQMLRSGERLSMTAGNLTTLQDDSMTSATNTTGSVDIEPDLSSMKLAHHRDMLNTATVMASFRTSEGDPHPSCPRSLVQSLVSQFSTSHNITFLLGFEIEVVFLHRPTRSSTWEPLTHTAHAWGTMSDSQHYSAWPLLTKIVDELTAIGIEISNFHSESGAGQYEFVLPPLPPIRAIDTLIQTRQAITQKANRHGLRATFHPRPLRATGTAAHVHISLHSPTLSAADLERTESAFFAGVLENLRALCAFSLPEMVSYERVRDDMWTGGTWVCWGTQNREVPLRKVKSGRWELRCVDGMANMYLAVAAVLGAGLWGVQEGRELRWGDCEVNPSKLTEEQRAELGIKEKLPASLAESLTAVENTWVLEKMMGQKLTSDYVVMKKAEMKKLEAMDEDKRRDWLLERY